MEGEVYMAYGHQSIQLEWRDANPFEYPALITGRKGVSQMQGMKNRLMLKKMPESGMPILNAK